MQPFMSPERWRQLEPIFDHALELDGGARATYLEQACETDPALRDEVEALLRADQDSHDFLGGSLESLLGGGATGHATDMGFESGATIGPYRVVRQLGEGGMGTVYLGARADGQFEQSVALKVIRRGRDSIAVHRRFLAERQILARLQHPGIARLIDGGLTKADQPWLAMEYVDGAPLLEWCDARKQSVSSRIALFEHVAEAVRYAHQNLVVHRDLKPSNILVTRDGQVKLLDFGIAKVLGPGMTAETQPGDTPATETGLLLLTPEYAAPEQVRGEAVTTATDVYALGAVLYELLSGERVHRFQHRSPVEIERVVCELEPEPPSVASVRVPDSADVRATVPRRLRQELRGDLDTIILTALQKAPARRYATVDALLGDLRNYRARLPITARPASIGYRVRKFARRHRMGVVAASTLALALAGGVAATLVEARATAREAARAEAVKSFLMSLFQTADPSEARGRDISARELLARGTTRIDSALAAQPAIKEELLSDLARIHRDLGLFAAADTLAHRAVGLARETHGEHSPEYAARLTEWGATSRLAGHTARADTVLTQALYLRQRILGPRHADVATTLTELAHNADDRGETPRANDLARKAMEIDREHYGPKDLRVARDLELLAQLHAEIEGEYTIADSAYLAALAIFRARYDAGHPDVIRVLNGRAANLRNMRRYPEAESLHREVLAQYRKLHPEGHPDVAAALHNLASVLNREQRYAESESAFAEALALRRRLGGKDLATIELLNDIGVSRAEHKDYAGAEVALKEAVDLGRSTLRPGHPTTVSALGNLAVVFTREKKYAEAEPVLRDVVAQRRLARSERPGLSRALTSLGVVLRDLKRHGEAEKAFREAEAIARENPEPRKNLLAAALSGLGVSFERQERLREAEPVLREAVALRRSYLDSAAMARLSDERQLGELLTRAGKLASAESVLVPAFHASAHTPGNQSVHSDLARALVTLYDRWGRHADASRVAADTVSRSR
jgi:serine/threonine protein kinase/tetratricopeptide (TPR) repeat protein